MNNIMLSAKSAHPRPRCFRPTAEKINRDIALIETPLNLSKSTISPKSIATFHGSPVPHFPLARPIISIGPGFGFAVPAMLLQRLKQSCIEGAGVAGGNVFFHVAGLAHPDNCGAHAGLRNNEAEHHF